MAEKGKSKGTWEKGDLEVVKIVYNGKTITPQKKKPEEEKKKAKK